MIRTIFVMFIMWAIIAISHDVHSIARDLHVLASQPAGGNR